MPTVAEFDAVVDTSVAITAMTEPGAVGDAARSAIRARRSALVGWTAVAAGVPLITRDRRALPTYRELGVDLVVLDIN